MSPIESEIRTAAAKAVGPRGGNLNNPAQYPHRRIANLNIELNAAGTHTLHRFEKPDTAAPGRANEQPWHRMAAFMLLAGRTNSEIGLAANVEATTVSHLRSQRWFQELLAVLANEQGDDLIGLLQSEAAASLQKLCFLRDNAESERIQLAAAQTLFEQAHGKPTQKIISAVSHSVHRSPQEEMDEINQELKTLQARK